MQNQTPFYIIIPARYQSSRLPGKPLLEIAGKPMIQRVVERCNLAGAERVVVATDDTRIFDLVNSFSGGSIMTSTDHPSGSDRIAEACEILGIPDDQIVVNVQGDEPDMPTALIRQVALSLYQDTEADMATASAEIDNIDQLNDPSVVKVVTDINQYALYFSRSIIPYPGDDHANTTADTSEITFQFRRHLGIYAYRAAYIKALAARTPCALENQEKLEQLRALWAGDKVKCVDAIETPGPGIDTPEDLERIRKQFVSCF